MASKTIAAACAAGFCLAAASAGAVEITLPAGYTAAYGTVYNATTDTSYLALAPISGSVTLGAAWDAIKAINAEGGAQGWLVTIYSAQENAAIVDGFASAGLDLTGYRIGAERGNTRDAYGAVIPDYTGPWYWNGNADEPLVYSNWAPGQPDNYAPYANQSSSRFVAGGQWDDTSADFGGVDAATGQYDHRGLVVEFAGQVSVSAVPEPASWALMLAGVTGLVGLTRRRQSR